MDQRTNLCGSFHRDLRVHTGSRTVHKLLASSGDEAEGPQGEEEGKELAELAQLLSPEVPTETQSILRDEQCGASELVQESPSV